MGFPVIYELIDAQTQYNQEVEKARSDAAKKAKAPKKIVDPTDPSFFKKY